MTVRAERLPALPDGVDRLVSAWPFKPYRWVPNAPAEGLDRLMAARLGATLGTAGTAMWAARCGGTLTGIAVLQPLAWDSQVLGMSAARLELLVADLPAGSAAAIEALLSKAAADARERGIRHVTARVDAGDHAAVQAFEAQGFVNVDALLTFAVAPEKVANRAPHKDASIRRGSVEDATVVGDLAAASFRHGRFHADPALTRETANDVYRTWGAACCEGTAADAVIVAEIDGRVAGFVACRVVTDAALHLGQPAATIPLIATAAAARGRGIGAALVAEAARWCRERAVTSLDVGTQLSNVAAARLYEYCGFRLVAGSLSFRLFIDP